MLITKLCKYTQTLQIEMKAKVYKRVYRFFLYTKKAHFNFRTSLVSKILKAPLIKVMHKSNLFFELKLFLNTGIQ